MAAGCVPRDDERPKEKQEPSEQRAARALPPSGAARPAAQPAVTRRNTTTDPKLEQPFRDDFQRPTPGPNWFSTKPGAWSISSGRLCGRNAHNHPVWLKRRIPTNARIEFDAVSSSADGDIKVEVWGDGTSWATGTSYNDATSYIAIYGGWRNRFHVLARRDEHAPDRKQVDVDPSGATLAARKVEANKTYHFKIERSDGKTVRWFVNDIQVLEYADPKPLVGPGHEHIGFNDWQVRVCFDNLVVTPLG